MTEPEPAKKIYVDSDWKQEAAEEKARLDQESKSHDAGAKLPEASFLELVNMLVTQAAISVQLTGVLVAKLGLQPLRFLVWRFFSF